MVHPNLISHSPNRVGSNKALPIAVAVTCLAALGVFSYFASVVSHFPGEVSFATWVQSWRTPWLDSLMNAVSALGIMGVAGALVVSVSAALYLKGLRAESLLVLVAPLVGRLLTVGLKNIVERPRPPDELVQVIQETDGYAFPSGQVVYYVVFLGTLLFLTRIGMRPTAGVRLCQAALVLATVVIGLARIYLGVHWPADVLAGYAFGAAVVAALGWCWWRLIGRRKAGLARR